MALPESGAVSMSRSMGSFCASLVSELRRFRRFCVFRGTLWPRVARFVTLGASETLRKRAPGRACPGRCRRRVVSLPGLNATTRVVSRYPPLSPVKQFLIQLFSVGKWHKCCSCGLTSRERRNKQKCTDSVNTKCSTPQCPSARQNSTKSLASALI